MKGQKITTTVKINKDAVILRTYEAIKYLNDYLECDYALYENYPQRIDGLDRTFLDKKTIGERIVYFSKIITELYELNSKARTM